MYTGAMWDFEQPARRFAEWIRSGQSAHAAFNLRDARFTYGPFQVFPRWPMGPMIELMALQAFLGNGDWLVLAEGLKPEGISPRALPA